MISRETHIAFVTRRDDPEKRGRVRVRCPTLIGNDAEIDHWVEPEFPLAGPDRGFFFVPGVGSRVLLSTAVADQALEFPAMAFLYNPDYRYTACVYGTKDEIPDRMLENYPERLGIVNRSTGLVLDASSDEAILEAFRIRLGSAEAEEPLALANPLTDLFSNLFDWLKTHVHTAPPSGGPTTPPTTVPALEGIEAAHANSHVSEHVYSEG